MTDILINGIEGAREIKLLYMSVVPSQKDTRFISLCCVVVDT